MDPENDKSQKAVIKGLAIQRDRYKQQITGLERDNRRLQGQVC